MYLKVYFEQFYKQDKKINFKTGRFKFQGGGGINTNPAKGNERKEILHIWNLYKDRGEEYRTGVNIHNNQT